MACSQTLHVLQGQSFRVVIGDYPEGERFRVSFQRCDGLSGGQMPLFTPECTTAGEAVELATLLRTAAAIVDVIERGGVDAVQSATPVSDLNKTSRTEGHT